MGARCGTSSATQWRVGRKLTDGPQTIESALTYMVNTPSRASIASDALGARTLTGLRH